jgi:hypothetical protein
LTAACEFIQQPQPGRSATKDHDIHVHECFPPNF